MHSYATLYRKELLEEVIPFWEKYSLDYASGGYFTCINLEGSVYDKDKFVWLQARQAWMFASLSKSGTAPSKPIADRWQEIAKHGIDFEAAQLPWDDPGLLEIPAKTTDEARFLVIGMIGRKHWSAVMTWRGENIRIISVRRSRTEEVELYES